MLAEIIGTPAMLEQTAEEATELAFACMKLARYLRGENKVYGKTREELYSNLVEELADIEVCKQELFVDNVINEYHVLDQVKCKYNRMKERLEGNSDN